MMRVITLKKNSGFSLMEFMVVIWILGILAAITVTSFDLSGWLDLYRLKGSAKDLLADMQKARMNAIAENRAWAISFDTANSCYRFQAKDTGGNWIDEGDPVFLGKGVVYGHGSATGDATDLKTVFPSTNPSDAVTFSNKRVTFDSLGLPSDLGGWKYCYLANSSGATFAVGTNTAGVIKMKKWNGNDWQ